MAKMINSSEVFFFVGKLKEKNHLTDLGIDVQQHYNAPEGYKSAQVIEMVQDCVSDKLKGIR